MTLLSFAQNQEDVMLWRALGHIRNGFYIDVGAADPVDLSVTKLFYDHGWHGINLEPQPAYFALLSAARPHDINLQLAAGREPASLIFHRIDGTGLSTFDAEIAARHRASGWDVVEETVDLLPLARICQQHRPHGPIHFLKVDVEGAEGDVLAGADFQRFRPWIVLVEATLPLSQEQSHAWEPILTSQGYSFVWFDGLNRFYLADEKTNELGKHFLTQPNVFDNFMLPSQVAQRAEHAEQELQQVRDQAAKELRQAHEQAAQALQQVREQAAETLREAELTSRQATATVKRLAHTADEANYRSAEAMQQMQHMAHTLNERTKQAQAALAEQTRRSDDAQHAAHAAQHAARQASEQVVAMLNSTSWRITAPLRTIRRMLPTKQLARHVFHRGARFLLELPGGQRTLQLVRTIAPGPVEWLARRYRVYEQTASMQQQAPVANTAAVPPPVSMSDLSPEEARLYQQLITAHSAATTSV
ncbi:FkbM family methyltransferase [Burkholderia anthina]|uniref:FkbM family methyltransferase n=1 Tax=Burkholderia anthina TaxID=179879 RepID=UPI00158E5F8E|nr:FkbM family methyltransferase [Burkholderia anthina]